jgi:hypothetical protein
MEATMFSGWIYDHLKPHAAPLKVAHSLMLRAIAAAKKKNDRIDARKIGEVLGQDSFISMRSSVLEDGRVEAGRSSPSGK